jgi:hypothetical protein
MKSERDFIKNVEIVLQSFEEIICVTPGALIFPTVRIVVVNRIQECIDTIVSNSKGDDFYLKTLQDFNDIKGDIYKLYTKKDNYTSYFYWYENNEPCTIVHYCSTFKEIRRGNLTGRNLTNPRKWTSPDALVKYWADNSINNIATYYRG